MESKKSRKCALPEELFLYEILSKLPTKSVIRFKSVSKNWLSLISEHSSVIAANRTAEEGEEPGSIISGRFSTDTCTTTPSRLFFLGHNESTLVEIDTSYVYRKNPDSFILIGSCNGLVCLKLLYPDKTHDLVLWNPATRELNYLPTEDWCGKYAIGYDDRSDVKVIRMKEEGPSLEAQIFSKTSGRWRNLKSSAAIPASVFLFVDEGEGLSVDGAIYWRRNVFDVLFFDVTKEEFGKRDGPLSLLDHSFGDCFNFELMKWRGSLGSVYVKPDGSEIQVWLKNKDSNDSESGWTKISTIQPSLGPISLGSVFNGQIILTRDDDANSEVFYDLATNEKREVEQGCLDKFRCCSHIREHFYTLISPN